MESPSGTAAEAVAATTTAAAGLFAAAAGQAGQTGARSGGGAATGGARVAGASFTAVQQQRMELHKARALAARRRRERKKEEAAVGARDSGGGRTTALAVPSSSPSSSSSLLSSSSAAGSSGNRRGGGGDGGRTGCLGGLRVVYESHLTRKYRCEQCGRLRFVDERLFKKFGVTVCKDCRSEHAQLYTTVLKTRAKAEFLISDDALAGLPHLERPNANNPSWAPLKLYLRKHVRDWAHAKYGGSQGLQLEQKTREASNDARRHKRNLARKRSRGEDEDDSKYELNTLKMGRRVFLRPVPDSSSSSSSDEADGGGGGSGGGGSRDGSRR